MANYIFIIISLFIQEPASLDAAIFKIRELNLNLWLMNGIWFFATCFDIWFGYVIGKWIQKKFQNTKFEIYSKNWAKRVESFVGRKGEKFALVLIGIINFPFINSFLASWLTIPFKNSFSLIFIGDLIYWGIAWAINLGVRGFFTDSRTALYVVIGIALVFSLISKALLSKLLKK